MVINHNIAALNTLSALNKNTAATQDSLEKLSTGSKINKAADDASGLAISQKMQAQINGLDQAQENVSNGTSLVQTAEGALGNVQDILQKMRTLANEAQNSGTQSSTDTSNLQDQANALAQEINRISVQTTFNTKDVFGNGSDGLFNNNGLQIQIGADSGQTIALTLTGTANTTAYSVATAGPTSVTFATATNQATVSLGGTTYTATFYATTADAVEGTNAISANAVASASSDGLANYATLTGPDGSVLQGAGGTAMTIAVTSTAETVAGWDGTASIAAATLSSATVSLGGVNVVDLGVGSGVGEAATAISLTGTSSIDTIQSAIDTVSKLRSKLGAYQNRMSYAGDTLGIESQNLTSAESTLTDTDVASEMMTYTKNNILVQSAQAMLAQANQLPQGMLSLLKS